METVEPGRGIQPIVSGDRIHTDESTVLGGDCKAGVAAILEGLEAVGEQGVARVPVQVIVTRGEETGLEGAKSLDYSMVRAREAVVFDGHGAVTNLTIATPTYIRFAIEVTGRAAHAGVEPEKGLSAIRIAADIITRLPQGRLDDETTFNVGTITGGSVRNAVPERASFVGEFRSRNPESLERVRAQLLETIEDARRRYPEATVNESLETEFHGYSLDQSEPALARVGRALASIGLEPTLGASGGGTDANIFAAHGTRSVVVGTATRDMHTVREYVEIPDLVDAARLCHALLTDPATQGG
jgi:tripeptide aminopeptidase